MFYCIMLKYVNTKSRHNFLIYQRLFGGEYCPPKIENSSIKCAFCFEAHFIYIKKKSIQRHKLTIPTYPTTLFEYQKKNG